MSLLDQFDIHCQNKHFINCKKGTDLSSVWSERTNKI